MFTSSSESSVLFFCAVSRYTCLIEATVVTLTILPSFIEKHLQQQNFKSNGPYCLLGMYCILDNSTTGKIKLSKVGTTSVALPELVSAWIDFSISPCTRDAATA